MEIISKYIPKEYLALKINYLQTMLSILPDVRITQRKRYGKMEMRCITGNHNYSISSTQGKHFSEIAAKRHELMSLLGIYEAEWKASFGDPVPKDIMPVKTHRIINPNNPALTQVLDSNYFDSLQNDANPNYREFKRFPYNGIMYRSKAEAEIAKFYTEYGIPFKYEPAIYLDGMNKPYHPDFVMLIKEIDCCKFHEHLGMLNSSDYLRENKIKLTNYINAGLVPWLDVFFTYNIDDIRFNVKSLMPTLNNIIYNSLITSPKQ